MRIDRRRRSSRPDAPLQIRTFDRGKTGRATVRKLKDLVPLRTRADRIIGPQMNGSRVCCTAGWQQLYAYNQRHFRIVRTI